MFALQEYLGGALFIRIKINMRASPSNLYPYLLQNLQGKQNIYIQLQRLYIGSNKCTSSKMYARTHGQCVQLCNSCPYDRPILFLQIQKHHIITQLDIQISPSTISVQLLPLLCTHLGGNAKQRPLPGRKTHSIVFQFLTAADEDELDYVGVLNRALPEDIRVLGWCPVPEGFNARQQFLPKTLIW